MNGNDNENGYLNIYIKQVAFLEGVILAFQVSLDRLHLHHGLLAYPAGYY